MFTIFERCLLKWMKGAVGYEGKWSNQQKICISNMLMSANKELPSEIHRALRPLKDIAFWKGSEFRTVLLYVGMVVFKDFLSQEIYEHFLLLSCAVAICSSDEYKPFLPKAREMFAEYIEDQIHLYGAHSISSNFHNLLHVVEDVERFGNLNKISTYEFENCLGHIKSKLKLYNKPVEQIARRMIELANIDNTPVDFEISFQPSVKYGIQFSSSATNTAFKDIIIRPNVLLSNRKNSDQWFLTTNKQIVKMEYAFLQNGEYFICGIPIIDKTDFFTHPFSSHHINIFKSKIERGIISNFRVSDYKAKLICFSILSDYVFIPLLHSF